MDTYRYKDWTIAKRHIFIPPVLTAATFSPEELMEATTEVKVVTKVFIIWTGQLWPSVEDCHDALYQARKRFYTEDFQFSIKFPQTGKLFGIDFN